MNDAQEGLIRLVEDNKNRRKRVGKGNGQGERQGDGASEPAILPPPTEPADVTKAFITMLARKTAC
jgi:hypothetical protein